MAGVTAERSSTEEISEGVFALKCLVCGSGCTDSDVLPSTSPSDENECRLLFHLEGPAEQEDPMLVSLALTLLLLREASSKIPCGLGLLFFLNLLLSLSLWIGGEGRRAKAEVGRMCAVEGTEKTEELGER